MKTPNLNAIAEKVCQDTSREPTRPAHLAALEHFNRKQRQSYPNGEFDGDRRYFLTTEEQRARCDEILSPSRAYPYSEMVHGSSLQRVAELFDADELNVRWLTKRIESELKTAT